MRGLFDTVRNLKRSKTDGRVCPKCGSFKIRNQSSLSGWILPDRYVCDECGYLGYLIVELEKENQKETP